MENQSICHNNTTNSNFRSTEGKSYSYWRLRILYSTIIGYSAFYLVRANLAIALPGMREEFDYTRAETGFVVTIYSLIYGLGKFFNGYFSDNSDARYFMSIGLFCSALLSAFVSISTGLVFLSIVWACNGWAQSMGWPPSAKLLTHWFSSKEIGTKWSIWSCSHQIGSAAIAILGGYLIHQYGWRSAFTVPAIISSVISLFLFNRLRNKPTTVGLPEVEIYKDEERLIPANTNNEKLTIKEIINLVLTNKLVWYVSLANMFLYIPRMGILTWAPTFLSEFKGADILLAGSQLAIFDIAGIPGAIIAGWFSDKVFKGKRGTVATVYLILLALSLVVLWQTPKGYHLLDTIALVFAGFLVAGPQVLAGIAIADFASKKAVGVATGFMGLITYMFGAAMSGLGIGRLVDIWGWDVGFIVFIVSALVAAMLFLLTCKTSNKN